MVGGSHSAVMSNLPFISLKIDADEAARITVDCPLSEPNMVVIGGRNKSLEKATMKSEGYKAVEEGSDSEGHDNC
jgi:hypothetical protein